MEQEVSTAGAIGIALIAGKKGVELLGRLLGPGATELGKLGGDAVREWRFNNQVKIATRAEALCREHNIAFAPTSRAFLVPLLGSAGDVEDESLQELWARLLASGLESARHQHPGFVEVLRTLSPSDAKLLQHAAAFEGPIPLPPEPDATSTALSASSLMRAGLFVFATTRCEDREMGTSYGGIPQRREPGILVGNVAVEVSPFGEALCSALRLTGGGVASV